MVHSRAANPADTVSDNSRVPRVIAHLVHGTWPKGGFLPTHLPRLQELLERKYPTQFPPIRPWFEAGSEFRAALEAVVPDIEWQPFTWTGQNLEAARRNAACEFSRKLAVALDNAKDACHVIIAHSHGGNVALWALGSLDAERRDRVAGLATMATPFLYFAPRELSATEDRQLRILNSKRLLYGALVFLAVAFLGIAIEFVMSSGWREWDSETWIEACLCAGVVFVWGTVSIFRKGKRREPVALHAQLPPGVCPDRLASFVAFRSRGDEASRAIAFADLGLSALAKGWSLVKLCAWLARWDDPTWRKKAIRVWLLLVLALWVVSMIAWWIGPAREQFAVLGTGTKVLYVALLPAVYAFLLGIIALCISLLPLGIANVVVSYSKVLLAVAFGADTASLAGSAEIQAEASPPNPPALLVQIEPNTAASRHSLHAIPAARTRLGEWIRERRSATCVVSGSGIRERVR